MQSNLSYILSSHNSNSDQQTRVVPQLDWPVKCAPQSNFRKPEIVFWYYLMMFSLHSTHPFCILHRMPMAHRWPIMTDHRIGCLFNTLFSRLRSPSRKSRTLQHEKEEIRMLKAPSVRSLHLVNLTATDTKRWEHLGSNSHQEKND